jgi:hypothetical protein
MFNREKIKIKTQSSKKVVFFIVFFYICSTNYSFFYYAMVDSFTTETRFSTGELSEIVKTLLNDSTSTAYAMLSLLETNGSTVDHLCTESGLLEWFAKEEEVTLQVDVNVNAQYMAGNVIDHVFGHLILRGFVGVSVSTIQPVTEISYSKWLHHDFVLVVPRDASCDVCKECYVVDAYVGCTGGSRVWKWDDWRSEFNKLLICVKPGSDRESLWAKTFRISKETACNVRDGTSVDGVTVKIFY